MDFSTFQGVPARASIPNVIAGIAVVAYLATSQSFFHGHIIIVQAAIRYIRTATLSSNFK